MYLYIPVQLCSLVNTFNKKCICISLSSSAHWSILLITNVSVCPCAVQLCSLVNTFNNKCICLSLCSSAHWSILLITNVSVYPCAALWWGKCRTCYPSLPPVDGGWVQPPHGPADRGSPKVCVKRMPRPPDSLITKGPLPEVHVQGWIQPPHALPPPPTEVPLRSVFKDGYNLRARTWLPQ